jgi:hypothetical protein
LSGSQTRWQEAKQQKYFTEHNAGAVIFTKDVKESSEFKVSFFQGPTKYTN